MFVLITEARSAVIYDGSLFNVQPYGEFFHHCITLTVHVEDSLKTTSQLNPGSHYDCFPLESKHSSVELHLCVPLADLIRNSHWVEVVHLQLDHLSMTAKWLWPVPRFHSIYKVDHSVPRIRWWGGHLVGWRESMPIQVVAISTPVPLSCSTLTLGMGNHKSIVPLPQWPRHLEGWVFKVKNVVCVTTGP